MRHYLGILHVFLGGDIKPVSETQSRENFVQQHNLVAGSKSIKNESDYDRANTPRFDLNVSI